MARRDVEGLEVVVVVLDLGAFDRLEPHRAEDPRDVADRAAHRMDTPEAQPPWWQGEIRRLGEALLDLPAAQRRAALLERGLDPSLRLVDRLAISRLLGGGHGVDRLRGVRDESVLAREVLHPRRLEGGLVRRRGDLFLRLVRHRLQVFRLGHHLSQTKSPLVPSLTQRLGTEAGLRGTTRVPGRRGPGTHAITRAQMFT